MGYLMPSRFEILVSAHRGIASASISKSSGVASNESVCSNSDHHSDHNVNISPRSSGIGTDLVCGVNELLSGRPLDSGQVNIQGAASV
jgi:hypothetical protein